MLRQESEAPAANADQAQEQMIARMLARGFHTSASANSNRNHPSRIEP
jgi:hypothetical protein